MQFFQWFGLCQLTLKQVSLDIDAFLKSGARRKEGCAFLIPWSWLTGKRRTPTWMGGGVLCERKGFSNLCWSEVALQSNPYAFICESCPADCSWRPRHSANSSLTSANSLCKIPPWPPIRKNQTITKSWAGPCGSGSDVFVLSVYCLLGKWTCSLCMWTKIISKWKHSSLFLVPWNFQGCVFF